MIRNLLFIEFFLLLRLFFLPYQGVLSTNVAPNISGEKLVFEPSIPGTQATKIAEGLDETSTSAPAAKARTGIPVVRVVLL